MTAIYLEPALVPQALRGAYRGNSFKARVCTEVTIPMDAGLWSGGSRDHYFAINFASGKQVPLPGQQEAPWGARCERLVKLEPGYAVVCHTMFRGKDLGLTYYLHPDNATRLLPAPVELTEHEKIVLGATCSLKSSYGGKDRYEMSQDHVRYGSTEQLAAFPTRAEWEHAKASLIERKLLNK